MRLCVSEGVRGRLHGDVPHHGVALHAVTTLPPMNAIITTTGHDRVGIIAGVATAAADRNLNILDVSQTLMDNYFTMIMRVRIDEDRPDIAGLQKHLAEVGERLGVIVRIQSEDLFTSMNEI